MCGAFTAVVWPAVVRHRGAPCPAFSATFIADFPCSAYEDIVMAPLPSRYVRRHLMRCRCVITGEVCCDINIDQEGNVTVS